MIYAFEGREYVESGEKRRPQVGDIFLNMEYSGFIVGASKCSREDQIIQSVDNGIRKILKLKENMENEYQIPILIKAMKGKAATEIDGTVLMVKLASSGFYEQERPVGGIKSSWSKSRVIAYPTKEQIEQERAAAKGLTLPAAILAALEAPNSSVCKGAREWSKGLMEAVMAEIEKVKA